MENKKNLFISGKPGSGKTTLIKEVCLGFRDRIGGFYTEEIMESGSRQGFVIKTFDGKSGVFAKKGMKMPVKLNKYGIDTGVLENVGVAALKEALAEKSLIVIDEIGSMEIVSEIFRKTLLECLVSPKKVLATIRYGAQPFTDEVKKMRDTSMLCLRRESFIETKKAVKEWMRFLG